MSEGEKTNTDYQYLVDTKGETTGILLSPKAFEAFEEYMIDKAMAQAAQDAKNEEVVPWEQVKAELVAEGKLDA